MPLKPSVNQTFVAAIVLSFLVFVTIVGIYKQQDAHKAHSAGLISATQELLLKTERFAALASRVETDSRAFSLTDQQTFLQGYLHAKKEVQLLGDTLLHLLSENPKQKAAIDTLRLYTQERIAFADSLLGLKIPIKKVDVLLLVASGKGLAYLLNTKRQVDVIQAEENKLLEQRRQLNQRNNEVLKNIVIAIAFAILALLVLLFWQQKKHSEFTRDADEKRKVSQEIETLHKQINQANDAIYTMDDRLQITSWNLGAGRLYGYTSAEVQGQYFPKLLQPALSEEELNSVFKKLQDQDHWSGEFVSTTKDGKAVQVRSSYSTVRDHNAEVIGYVAVSYDISLQHKMQEEITQLANLVEHTSDAIFSRGLDRRIISWNKGAESMFGYTKQEAVGRTALELNLTNRQEEEIEAVESLIKKNGSWHAELYHNHKNGSSFYAAVSGSAMLPENGKDLVFYFIVRDISERKKLEDQLRNANDKLEEKVQLRTAEILRTEQQYRHLFQNNPLPMWVFDTDTFKFLDVNEMATRKYGYSRADFLGMTLMDIRPPEDRELFLSTDHGFDNSIDDAQLVWNHLKKDGSIIQVEISAHQIDFGGRRGRLILANDVTERIKAEKTLASSEKRFRTLIENSNDILTLMDADFKIVYRSPSTFRITGWGNEEMLTIEGTSNIHPDDLHGFNEKIQEIMRHPEKPLDVFFRSRHKAGHYIWLEGTIVNLLHQEHVKAIVFNARDVSDRIASDERIRQTFKELTDYKVALDESSIVAITDQYGTINYVNENFCAISKFTRDELIGNNHRIVNSGHHSPSFFVNLWKTISKGKIWKGEIKNQAKDGTIYWVDTTIVPFMDEHGKPYQYVAIRADITDRKRSEEQLTASEKQFRHSMDNMLEGVQIIGFDWKYIYVNEALARQGKYAKANFIGKTIMEVYPGIEETSIFTIYQRCFSERIAIHLENEFVFPDKSVAWFELSLLPVPEGIFILSIDISERKRAEEEIKKINAGLEESVNTRTEELRKANEELEGFSYSVSHDLRAPLRAIIGFSAILEEDYAETLGEEGKRITSVIKSNTMRMGNLIDDLLTFSRTGRSELVKTTVDNNDLVATVIANVDTKNHTSIIWKIANLPESFGETNMLRQVWVNIIQNAAKYSAHSQPPVIEIGSYAGEGETVFFVKDNGVGFDEKYKSKLFKVFQRLHSGEQFEGTGIGLAIVEKIVSKHGGSVWAEGGVDKGASFYFTIPTTTSS